MNELLTYFLLSFKRLLKLKSLLAGLTLSLVLVSAALAQEITFQASVNRNPIPAGDRFTLTFTLSNIQGKVAPPDLKGLTVVFGPSTSQSYNYINGRSSSSSSVSYVLIAEKEGKVQIGRAKAYTDKGVLERAPIPVPIEKISYTGNATASNNTTTAQAAPSTTQTGDIILSVVPSKTKAAIGEPIAVTYYLYSRYQSLELGKYEFPPIGGFWCEDIKQESVTWDNQLATINGMRYKVAALKRQVIYPQKSGKFTVKPFEVECVVNRSFFSVGSTLKVKSNSPVIEVSAFPGGAPASFQGISGQFKLESSISSPTVKANEPITLKLKISGDGNLKVIADPQLNFPADFEVYDPKVNDRIRVTTSGLTGSREWEYLVIPRFPGEYTLPAYTFSYFDLATKSYKTLSSTPFTLKVSKGSGQAAGTFSGGGQNQVKLLNRDIRYIYTDQLPENTLSPFSPKSAFFWIAFSSIPLALAGIALTSRKQKALRKDQVKLKASVANKIATKRLTEAKKALHSKNDSAFYEATSKALYGYLSDKFNIAAAELSSRSIAATLGLVGLSPVEVTRWTDTLDGCEMARFAPSAQITAAEVYQTAVELIANLEKNQGK